MGLLEARAQTGYMQGMIAELALVMSLCQIHKSRYQVGKAFPWLVA